jgi:hypothetical protein
MEKNDLQNIFVGIASFYLLRDAFRNGIRLYSERGGKSVTDQIKAYASEVVLPGAFGLMGLYTVSSDYIGSGPAKEKETDSKADAPEAEPEARQADDRPIGAF